MPRRSKDEIITLLMRTKALTRYCFAIQYVLLHLNDLSDKLHIGTSRKRPEEVTSTTLLVSPRTERFNLVGLKEPEDEILEQPEKHLLMHGRQRASRDAGGKKPLREAETRLSDNTSGNCKQA